MKFSEDRQNKLYIILTLRHENIFGDNFCLFWGYDKSPGGYTGNPYHAHRFTYEEAKRESDGELDIMIDIDLLELDKGYIEHNKYIRCMIEKGTLNRVLGLRLRPSNR